VLSKRFYALAGKKGVYTRKKGLDRDTNKALLLKHNKDNKTDGSRLLEMLQVLPSLTVDQVKTLLREMKKDEQIHVAGRTRYARWFPGSGES
jgi:ATP-dependent DNA helicase RecG